MKVFSYILGIIILVIGVTFALLNASAVTLHYYIGSVTLSLSLLLVLTLGIGVLLGLCFALVSILKAKRQNHLLRSKIRQLEKQQAVQ